MTDLEFFQDCIQKQIDANPIPVGRLDFERSPIEYTIGDFIRACMEIDTESDAQRFYTGYVENMTKHGTTSHDPVDVARSNIGWCFGEGMAPKKIAMWRQVCDAAHPVFGSYEKPPTLQESYDAGLTIGKAKR
jgi:hypothetical protein